MGTYCVRLKGVEQEQQLDEIMIIEPQEWDAVQEKLNRVLNKLGPRNKKKIHLRKIFCIVWKDSCNVHIVKPLEEGS